MCASGHPFQLASYPRRHHADCASGAVRTPATAYYGGRFEAASPTASEARLWASVLSLDETNRSGHFDTPCSGGSVQDCRLLTQRRHCESRSRTGAALAPDRGGTITAVALLHPTRGSQETAGLQGKRVRGPRFAPFWGQRWARWCNWDIEAGAGSVSVLFAACHRTPLRRCRQSRRNFRDMTERSSAVLVRLLGAL